MRQKKAGGGKPGTSLAQLKGMLRHFGLRAKKSLGQHFLVDDKVLHSIVSAAELSPEDLVIEVGPGLGILTKELAIRAKRVIAIELDSRLAFALSQIMIGFPDIQIINANVLETDPAQLLAHEGWDFTSALEYKVVADLPYYIACPTLRHFLEASLKPNLMVVLLQKEVGEAIVAKPGEMSLLAVSVQFYGKPEILHHIQAESFYPPPKVESVILRIIPFKQPVVKVPDIACFFELVRAGFSSPRKQLHNSLAQGLGLSPHQAAALLEKAEIDLQRRAETLSLEEWARVYHVSLPQTVELPC